MIDSSPLYVAYAVFDNVNLLDVSSPLGAAADHLVATLGRPLWTYRPFAEETAVERRKPILEKVADAVLPGRAA